MPSSYTNDDTRAELQDLWALLRLAQAAVVQSDTPLVRTRFIDGDTLTPAANANGAIGRPYASATAFFTAIGNNVSVADANQMYLGLVSPATTAAYTETPTVPAYRNVTIRCLAGLIPGNFFTGNWTWNNTAAAGGVNAGSTASLTIQDAVIAGNFTYTDDGGAPSTTLLFTSDALSTATMLSGNITATGGTKLGFAIFNDILLPGNVVSTANATGASLLAFNTTFTGNITCKTAAFTQCTFTGGVGQTITFNSGATPKFIDCNFTAGATIVAGATGIITMDGQSWSSFKEGNGAITSGIVLIVGGSSQGIVMCPPTGAPTSIGDQSVSISLNGTGATNAGGFNGTLGGNYYEAATALTGNRTVTIKTGGGELTGDTITVCRRGAGISANTLSCTNNGGTETRVIAAAAGGFQTWQFNTVVANDWGFIAGGGAIT